MRVSSLALLLLIVGAGSLPALADSYVYSYTGNDFNSVFGSYTTNDSVTGEFTISAPLADGLTTLTTIKPMSFSFSDGIGTVTNAGGGTIAFQVETNASGAITQWDIYVESNTNPLLQDEIETVSVLSNMTDEADYGVYTSSDGWSWSQGANLYSPGTWTITDNSASGTATTPEPGSLALLATGMLAMAWFVHRKFGQPSAG